MAIAPKERELGDAIANRRGVERVLKLGINRFLGSQSGPDTLPSQMKQ
jgi:hypothetical protein